MVEGYVFPNELAEPLLWRPVMFAYTLLISGSDLLILSALAYLTGTLRKAIPLMTMLGISFFAVVLLGPLADLKSPQRSPLIFLSPHVVPTGQNPGISLIAFQSIMWLIGLVLMAAFALLTFSYHAHQASLETTGIRRGVYRFLSFGVTSEQAYRRLELPAKLIAIVALPPLTLWGMYPASLLVMQSWNPVWRGWTLLPVIYFADTFVTATALFVIAYFVIRGGALERDVLSPVLKVHAAGSLSVAALTGLQVAIWQNSSRSFAELVTPLVGWMHAVIALLLVSFLLSLAALRYPVLSIAVALIAFAGTVTNKWNILVNAQLVSYTASAWLVPEFHGEWLLELAAPIAAGIAVFVLLSLIFPLEVRERGQQA